MTSDTHIVHFVSFFMSAFMNFNIYNQIITQGTTSIQVFASSSCAVAYVLGKLKCIEHGRQLKWWFINNRPNIYVRYDVVGSTVASFSRMMNAKVLICPPGIIQCLLPALGKQAGKKAFIAEDSSHAGTYHWFEENVLKERKRIGFQDPGFVATSDEDFLDIISDV